MGALGNAAATFLAAIFLVTASVTAREIPAGAGASAGVQNVIPPRSAPAAKKHTSSKKSQSKRSQTSKKRAAGTSKKRATKRSSSKKPKSHGQKPAAKHSGATGRHHQG